MRIGIFIALLIAVVGVRHAKAETMYKCQDAKGTISYSMTKCDPGSTELWSRTTGKAGSKASQPRPQPKKAEMSELSKGLNILSVDSKVTEKNSSWWRYSWRLTVHNNSDKPQEFRANLKLLDADGFVVDDRRTTALSLKAHETHTFTDYLLVRMPGAASVRETQAQLFTR